MQMTRASTYALKALTYLARQKSDAPIPSHVVAEAARDIPKLFLLKCLLRATSAGLLRSLKGPNGGYVLARPPRQISVLEVVEAVDGPIRGDAPAVGRDGAASIDKKLQGVCDGAAALVRARLGRVTLADLAKGR
jgi:Rrf2 family protein